VQVQLATSQTLLKIRNNHGHSKSLPPTLTDSGPASRRHVDTPEEGTFAEEMAQTNKRKVSLGILI
jgi:hypothetical protein